MKRYWLMKTSEEEGGKPVADYWAKFRDPSLNEGKTVIAIGWNIGPNPHPDRMTSEDILAFITKEYGYAKPNQASTATSTIWRFLHDMHIGDEVMLCKGYPPRQRTPVYVYGFAEIRGTPWNHTGSSWGWRLKREAWYTDIIERGVDIAKFKELSGKGSLRRTIHPTEAYNFEAVREWLTRSTTTRRRSPDWTRDELILALNLYFSFGRLPASEQHPDIVRLSRLLNDLPIHPVEAHQQQFRNPNGVYMKLCNFLRLDPDYPGSGLDAGSKLDIEVWNEFYGDRDRLKEVADAIVQGYQELTTHGIRASEVDEDEEFPEGKIVARYHRYRERNQSLVNRKKSLVLQRTGKLECEVCGFDFAVSYGEPGAGFAECHHDAPLSGIGYARKVKLADLSIVCPNCHRVIHRRRPWLNTAELKALLDSRNKL